MQVGTVKEIKNNENRVGLTPAGARELAQKGHTVLVEKDAGAGSGFSDEEYKKAGAKICTAKEAWQKSDLIVKVKEPMPAEFEFIRQNQIIFTYFHFASNEALLDEMLKHKAASIAYETVGDNSCHPLLAPMSEVAGKMAPLMGAYYLAKFAGGRGLLLSGVSGVEPAHVVILGTGFVGRNAGIIAQGLQAKLTFLVYDLKLVPDLKKQFPNAEFVESRPENIERIVPTADLLVGAVYVTGAKPPVLVSKELVQKMQKGSVIVDVAIDQGGCIETSKATSHSNPIFEKFGVIHYCVANMPGAFPRTSTLALTNATLPFVIKLAGNGLKALKEDPGFLNGLTTLNGKLVNRQVAEAFKRKAEDPLKMI
ncbi:MAG: alanine dehydrogenase [Candidatus ainarchaeum sp.]|nr:alanine dehydrogenase [Candidatus ainarchaeum sp.]